MLRRILPLSAFLLAPTLAHAAPGAGTLADPIRIDAFPYAIRGTTVSAPSDAIDSYACAAATDESGHEVVYAFELKTKSRVNAWVTGDSASVDIDVHLLDDATITGAVAQSCVARSNNYTEADLGPGLHYVVVDTYAGEANAGPFVLSIDAIGETWTERYVAEGVLFRSRRFDDPTAGPQVVHALFIDLKDPAVTLAALPAVGCQTVAEIGSAAGAVAGVNGGLFGGASCTPVSLLKHEGNLLATNAVARGAFGLTADMTPMVGLVAAGADLPTATEAQGGGPILVTAKVAAKGALAWAAEGFSSPPFLAENPRTVAGFDSQGRALLSTVDGGRANAGGMSLDDLAAFALAELHADSALNLDGGGSTTMWVAGQTPNGVVNYPSDDPGQELPSHPGSRPVSGGLFVFAPPYAHPPRFQTEPVTEAAVGTPYTYDADAIDLDVDDTVSFALGKGPAGMTVDPATGVVSYTPPADADAEIDVVLLAKDNTGLTTEQPFCLTIGGGSGSGNGCSSGGGGGSGGGSGGGDGRGSASDDGGCGCRVGGSKSPGSTLGGAFFLAVGLLAGRRAHRLRLRARVARPEDAISA